MPGLFIDTNVFIRHLTQDHAEFSPMATAFFARIERGEIKAQTSETCIFEAVFTLEKRYRAAKPAIREGLFSLIELPGLQLPGKGRLRRAFDLYVDRNMSFGDASHIALMEQLGITEIASFDKDFDRVPGISRVEPR